MPAKFPVLLSLVVLLGCGGSNNPLNRQPVSGKVQLDGKPLASGSIQFTSISGPPQTIFSGGLIENGTYQLSRENGLPPGTYQVSISSSPPAAAIPSDPADAMQAAEQAATSKELIPEKYNLKSELKVEIQSDARAVHDFDLKS